MPPKPKQPVASYGWRNCPEPIRALVNDILKRYQTVLGGNLTGFYLHGSLAMNCFNPLLSDIDFLTIVEEKLKVGEKRAIIHYLLELHENSPFKRIEMSIVLEEYLRNFAYPTLFELHYSIDWYERYKTGQAGYSEENSDEDLAAHFVITRERGLCLYGKPIRETFLEIPKASYIKSLLNEAEWVCQHAVHTPFYAILNLCRIIAFLKHNEVTSKKEGAEWALSNLPEEFSPLINSALRRYLNTKEVEQPDISNLSDFIEYARREINSLIE